MLIAKLLCKITWTDYQKKSGEKKNVNGKMGGNLQNVCVTPAWIKLNSE